jgi:hypothetical protein
VLSIELQNSLCKKYDKQDRQGKAAFNERSPHPTQNLVQARNAMSQKVHSLENHNLILHRENQELRNKVKELERVNLEQAFRTSDSLFENIMGKENEESDVDNNKNREEKDNSKPEDQLKETRM